MGKQGIGGCGRRGLRGLRWRNIRAHANFKTKHLKALKKSTDCLISSTKLSGQEQKRNDAGRKSAKMRGKEDEADPQLPPAEQSMFPTLDPKP